MNGAVKRELRLDQPALAMAIDPGEVAEKLSVRY